MILHVGDIGTVFTIYCRDGETAVDLSETATKNIVFQKPGGTNVTQTAGFSSEGDGTDGILTYTTISGDLDTAGEWWLQAQVTFGAGPERSFTKERFHVHAQL